MNEESRYQLKKLLGTEELEVRQTQNNGLLTDSTARAYLLHASNLMVQRGIYPGWKEYSKLLNNSSLKLNIILHLW